MIERLAQVENQREIPFERTPMKNYKNPGAYIQRQGIHFPALETNFELKPSFLALLPN